MISTNSVLFTLVLFSELSSHLVAQALPGTKVEDGIMEQESFNSLLGEEAMTEHAMVPSVDGQSFIMENGRDEDRNPNVIFVSKGHRVRGQLNPSFTKSLPLLTARKLSYNPHEYSLKMDRRNADISVMRCMIGRVYRPCWGSDENL